MNNSSRIAIERIDHQIASTDSRSQLHVALWVPALPEGYLRGIVQIVHGMSEHLDRYDEFARFLAQQGFVVGAHDHIGHGRSVSCESQLGHMPLKTGKDVLINDVHKVREELFSTFDRLPYIIFGHSMGSFVARAYVSRLGTYVDGAIFSGTGNMAFPTALLGNTLARGLGVVRGEEYHSAFLDGQIVGAFNKGIRPARTPYDWLSHDERVVDAYLADPLCGKNFTVGGYTALTDLVLEVISEKAARQLPSDLPLFFIAGGEDPVGENGQAVMRAVDLYKRSGVRDVEVILYPHMRHEILNEFGKEIVERDIVMWIEHHVLKGTSEK